MTKKIVSVSLIVLVAVIYFFMKKENTPALNATKTQAKFPSSHVSVVSPPVITSPKRTPASVGYVNAPSKDWEARLTNTLKTQGGEALKEIKIVKEKTMVWTRDDVPLHAQSVVVTLTNKQEVQSSFRAIVDSQTGKVLETWDQTISDPADVRGGFRFKLDPRYSN